MSTNARHRRKRARIRTNGGDRARANTSGARRGCLPPRRFQPLTAHLSSLIDRRSASSTCPQRKSPGQHAAGVTDGWGKEDGAAGTPPAIFFYFFFRVLFLTTVLHHDRTRTRTAMNERDRTRPDRDANEQALVHPTRLRTDRGQRSPPPFRFFFLLSSFPFFRGSFHSY